MELEEMKSLWEDMGRQVGQQKILTDKLILDLTQERYTNKLRGISVPETIGAFICFVAVVYIVVNFGALDVWYLQLAGGITVLTFLILPILSLKAVQRMKVINITENTYKQTLQAYAKGSVRFIRIQKLSFYMGFLMLLVLLPVFAKIMNNIDVFALKEGVKWWVPSGIGVLYIFMQWVFKKYKKTINSAEAILKELKE